MKLCGSCGRAFSGETWDCPACGYQPPRIQGFLSFSPKSADLNEHFSPESFGLLAPLEDGHFWFRGRNELIVWALRHWFLVRGRFLEIGCGTGYVLSRIEREFPGLETWGGEIYSKGLEFAAKRLTRSQMVQMDASHMPFQEEFNIIGLFDTLEHIREDEAVLAQVHRALVPGGGLLLTVPQHAFLWSRVDEVSGHVRRYERTELVRKVQEAGFQVVAVTSFVFLLLPVLWLTRWWKKEPKTDFDEVSELKLHPFLNWALGRILALERFLIRLGLRVPWGGSLLLAARKESRA